MVKKNLRLLIITSIIILLPIIAGVILWNDLPDQLPIHFDIEGEADSYAGKAVAVFVMPAILLAVHWFCTVVTASDPKNKNANPKTLKLIFWVGPAISVFVCALIYTEAFGIDSSLEKIVPLILGVLFIAIGNYMPKCKQSYTIGIKLPWTLSSEENWNKTHRLAGIVWVIGGILIIATSFFKIQIAILIIALLMILIPMVYSFVIYQKEQQK